MVNILFNSFIVGSLVSDIERGVPELEEEEEEEELEREGIFCSSPANSFMVSFSLGSGWSLHSLWNAGYLEMDR